MCHGWGSRLPAMALLTKRWGPKEQVREAYSPFYRIQNGTVTSLRWPYDITGEVPNTSLTVPGDVGKRINRSREWLKKRNGGATVTKARGLSNRMGAERSHTAVP